MSSSVSNVLHAQETRLVPCPICGESTRILHEDVYDDRYGYTGLFSLQRCAACGHIHLDAPFEPHHLTRLYTQYYPRSTFSVEHFVPYAETAGIAAWWRGDRCSAFRWVPRNVRVLDVGCGFGQTLAYHERRGCEAHGVEADENIRRVAERYGFKVQVGLFDASRYEAGYFDVVTLDQVIEHSLDPVALLRGVARVLKPGGTAFVTTPNASSPMARLMGRYWLHWHAPYHLQFFSAQSMRLAAEEAGLVMERRRTTTSSEWLHYQWLHLFAFPRPGRRSAFWSPGVEARFFYRKVYRVLSAAHRLKINYAATRVLDLLGLGDNQLFVLRRPGAEGE